MRRLVVEAGWAARHKVMGAWLPPGEVHTRGGRTSAHARPGALQVAAGVGNSRPAIAWRKKH